MTDQPAALIAAGLLPVDGCIIATLQNHVNDFLKNFVNIFEMAYLCGLLRVLAIAFVLSVHNKWLIYAVYGMLN